MTPYSVRSDRHDPGDPDDAFVGGVACERRRSHRETVVAIGRLLPIEGTNRVDAASQILVTDVSLHGCDFRSTQAVDDGAIYRLELAVGPLALTSRARITRISVRSDGTYEVGAEFV